MSDAELARAVGGGIVAIALCLLVAPRWVAAVPIDSAGASGADGRSTYAQHCAKCHGAALQGLVGPSLSGETFAARWRGRSPETLGGAISQMPPNAPGSLSKEEYVAVKRFVLASNHYTVVGGALAPLQAGQDGHEAKSERPSRASSVLPAPPAAVAQPSSEGPVDADLEDPADSWPAYNRDYRGQRFSALAKINRSNIRELRPLCMFQLGENGSFQASPVIFKEWIYLSTAHGTYAIDARTCKKVWQYDYTPQNDEPLPVNRGVSLYEGKVLRLTPDGWLLALDAVTGKRLWYARITDTSQGRSWLSAVPVGFNGRIYFGTAGADRDSDGHVYALDANTGRLVWTFNAIPRGKEPGAETWGAEGQRVGGGSSWSTISIDPRERRLYVPLGNPGSDFDGTMRPGANLYTDSVVVLDSDTGKLLWYAQQVPHDVHDYDTAAAPLLYEANHRKYMAVASKSGWLYVYDRDTHELVFKREVTTQLNADAVPTPAGVHVCPGILGGSAWNGAALDATGGRLIVPGVDLCGTLLWLPKSDPNFEFGRWKPDPTSKGWLRAFDAVTGEPVWADEFLAPMVAGVTTTAAGLAFTGSIDGEFFAIDSATGEILYKFQTGGAIAGGISSFAVDGHQVIAVASGNTSRLTFATTGAATLILFGLPSSVASTP